MTPKEFKELRQKLGITQKEMAGKLGITRSQVAKLESGRCKINGAVRIICKNLKADCRDF